jgi:hypothetical protein
MKSKLKHGQQPPSTPFKAAASNPQPSTSSIGLNEDSKQPANGLMGSPGRDNLKASVSSPAGTRFEAKKDESLPSAFPMINNKRI